jgi:hypothetical protein
VVVTSNVEAGSLSLFRISEGGHAFPLLHTFGVEGSGPLQFNRPSYMCAWRRPPAAGVEVSAAVWVSKGWVWLAVRCRVQRPP